MRGFRQTPGAPWLAPARHRMPYSFHTQLRPRPLLPKSSPDVQAMYGWSTVDGARIPHVMRGGVKFVSVRMVEIKYLSKYPSTYPAELQQRAPLKSQYMSASEASLLTAINRGQCGGQFGDDDFTTHDLVVALKDFLDFYHVVKRHYPHVHATSSSLSSSSSGVSVVEAPVLRGGWVQVNNTLVPYVTHGRGRFVPLSVLRYGANLLRGASVSGVEASERDVICLNQLCKKAGVDFTFTQSKTRLLELSAALSAGPTRPVIVELPATDPLHHAQYQETTPPAPPTPQHVTITTTSDDVMSSAITVDRSRSTGRCSSSTSSSTSSSSSFITKSSSSTGGDVLDLSGPSDVRHQAIKAALTTPPSTSPAHLTQVARPPVSVSHSETRPVTPEDRPTPRLHLHCTALRGKGITSIQRGPRAFVLVESLNRMFFPSWSLDDFRSRLGVVGVVTDELSEEEEQAFIAHYELRIARLRATHIVSLFEVETNMDKLEEMYKHRDKHGLSRSGCDITHSNQVTDKETAKQGTRMGNSSNSNKRPASEMTSLSFSKRVKMSRHATGKLEDIMSKLKKAQLNRVSATDND